VSDWRLSAACRGHNTDLWFSDDQTEIAEAKTVCYRCPVRTECGDDGRAEAYGVWGGTTPEERGTTPSYRKHGWKPPTPTECRSCLTVFTPPGGRGRSPYCSEVCRTRGQRDTWNRHDKRRRAPTTFTVDDCGEEGAG
jgi:WhiB family redox-sensing transcriptional regulator